MINLSVDFPEAMQSLFTPEHIRYRVFYGGRGSGKSWNVARALIIKAAQKKIKIMCAREYQNSIRESVHSLLSEQIEAMGFRDFFDIKNSEIVGKNGSEFIFVGLKHNIQSVKSINGVNICWIEEAQTVSKQSYDVLIPTIREKESEIWVTFNPELEDDFTYSRFVTRPLTDSVVTKVNWSDNPWFPDVLKAEMEELKKLNYDDYLNVWEGQCKQMLDGAVYARELREVTEEERITKVPYDPSKPVHTFWDLGFSDATSIWFAQQVGLELRVLRYIEGTHKRVADWLSELQGFGYVYGTHYLPHDAANKTIVGLSVQDQIIAAGHKAQIVPKLSVSDGINAARNIMGKCWFDRSWCQDGLHALRHYRYEYNDDKKMYGKEPLHDWASHGADAFRYMAVVLRDLPARRAKSATIASNSWMG